MGLDFLWAFVGLGILYGLGALAALLSALAEGLSDPPTQPLSVSNPSEDNDNSFGDAILWADVGNT
jgi:hypothetical protein